MFSASFKKAIHDKLGTSFYFRARSLLYACYGIAYRNDLVKLGRAFGSDKATFHSYATHYQTHFRALKNQPLKILEIGIGGYENPMAGGESLPMWKSYFPRARVFGIDIHDKSFHDEARVRTFVGSQIDKIFLRKVLEQVGVLDIIIDDGSHVNRHVIDTFSVLFPLLRQGGVYAIEDLQTSYWDNAVGGWGGSRDLQAPHTSMNFLKRLVDGLNHQEFLDPLYEPTYFDQNITSVHFYHNLAIVYKGKNVEPSNRPLF